ncbi:hypothetical protein [Roseateles amylovorans]|uniref:Uncharacterized protein n=1 Tax=Roseateles amylovorans TaxID=2978473 RepID=A0ABY6B4F7_9BURK|nr:hypothetical protein [Roseateles amylovorans]UXH79932.1 hypothetical protein N4261_08655 [Roseateles amylovorans]
MSADEDPSPPAGTPPGGQRRATDGDDAFGERSALAVVTGSSVAQQLAQTRATMGFEFTLRYEIDEHDAWVEAVMERLEASGCTETLVGASVTGLLELQFIRHATSAEDALASASQAVRRAFPSAKLVKIVPAPDTPTPD